MGKEPSSDWGNALPKAVRLVKELSPYHLLSLLMALLLHMAASPSDVILLTHMILTEQRMGPATSTAAWPSCLHLCVALMPTTPHLPFEAASMFLFYTWTTFQLTDYWEAASKTHHYSEALFSLLTMMSSNRLYSLWYLCFFFLKLLTFKKKTLRKLFLFPVLDTYIKLNNFQMNHFILIFPSWITDNIITPILS